MAIAARCVKRLKTDMGAPFYDPEKLRTMGKQVQVAMLEDDEALFLAFLREKAEIQLLEYFAPTPEKIFTEKMGPRDKGHWHYRIWNKSFPWTPKFAHVASDAKVVERRGWSYVANAGTAPLVEYSRHNFAPNGSQGRLYWAKYFSAPNGVDYDVESFERWYDSIARWIRKNGRRDENDRMGRFHLPSAWAARMADPGGN
jgi:hypothetical protein